MEAVVRAWSIEEIFLGVRGGEGRKQKTIIRLWTGSK